MNGWQSFETHSSKDRRRERIAKPIQQRVTTKARRAKKGKVERKAERKVELKTKKRQCGGNNHKEEDGAGSVTCRDTEYKIVPLTANR